MRRKSVCAVSIFVAVTAVNSPALAEGDPGAGAQVYKKCVPCHSIDQPKNKIGPHMIGIFGRKAGGLENFKYSSALRDSEIVWNDETIAAFVKNTRNYIPGNRMAFAGIKDDGEIADLIAFMKEKSSQ